MTDIQPSFTALFLAHINRQAAGDGEVSWMLYTEYVINMSEK
jgi:hypothetical protein